MKRRGEELGEARIREVEAEWPRLIAQVRAQMEAGADPKSETVHAQARRWRELVAMFTGGDAGVAASVGALYRGEPALRERTGIDMAMFEYIGRALA